MITVHPPDSEGYGFDGCMNLGGAFLNDAFESGVYNIECIVGWVRVWLEPKK